MFLNSLNSLGLVFFEKEIVEYVSLTLSRLEYLTRPFMKINPAKLLQRIKHLNSTT